MIVNYLKLIFQIIQLVFNFIVKKFLYIPSYIMHVWNLTLISLFFCLSALPLTLWLILFMWFISLICVINDLDFLPDVN